MGHKERVLDYLKAYGSIMPLEALDKLGVYRLSAVIFELRKDYDITTENTNVTNRHGDKCIVAKYILNSKVKQSEFNMENK